VSEAAALLGLAAILAAAVARPRWAPDWAVAALAALVLLATGVLSTHQADHTLTSLGPAVGFLAALLLLADGCRRAGLFDSLGALIAAGARGQPRRLLALVFAAASLTTAVLSLDATVLLLTPVVFATTARLRVSSRPHVYACSHLANSASLLLPISNLTNLLVFESGAIGFDRFAELMVLPWIAVLAIEWFALRRMFAADLRRPGSAPVASSATTGIRLPPVPLAVVGLTLVGLALHSVINVAAVWVAAAGAVALVAYNRPEPRELVRAAEPLFLVFVLGLGLVVSAAGVHGLSSAVHSLIPHGTGLPALLAIAAIGAVLANLVNNLPATLIMLPAAALSGPGALLAMLVGVNIGPNLTYTGSLATLLWRRVLHAHDQPTDLVEFTRLGLLTVPPALIASTVALWLALRIT
jgi:arsenical pump membrane protein